MLFKLTFLWSAGGELNCLSKYWMWNFNQFSKVNLLLNFCQVNKLQIINLPNLRDVCVCVCGGGGGLIDGNTYALACLWLLCYVIAKVPCSYLYDYTWSVQGERGHGSSVGIVCDSWWGGPGFNSRFGHPLPAGLVSVSVMWAAETEVMVSSALSHVWQHVKLSDISLGIRPRYSLVVEEDVTKQTNQTRQVENSWCNIL